MLVTLWLHNEPVYCYTEGNAESEHIFLTIGPGSIYFPIYGQKLKEQVRFIAFDKPWIHPKGSLVDKEAIDAITLETLINEIRSLVGCLKERHPNKKIHLLANSIVTGLALKCAESIPEIDSTVCIGTPLKPVTPDFSHVKKMVTDDKATVFQNDMARYNAMMNGEQLDKKQPESNVVNGRLTPVSEFVEQCQSLRIPTIADYQRYDNVVAKMWRHAPSAHTDVLNIAMRDHFFNNVQRDINIPETLSTLNQRGDNVFLAWGKKDGITPYDQEQLNTWPNIRHEIFEQAGHFPQLESKDAFDAAVLDFIQRSPRKRATISN